MNDASNLFQKLEFDKALELVCGFCCTEAGRARVRERAPLFSASHVRRESARTAEMRRFLAEVNPGWDPGAAADITARMEKLHTGRALEPNELLAFARLLELGEAIRKTRFDEDDFPLAAAFQSMFFVDPPLRRAIERAVDESGGLRDDASPELRRARKGIRRLEQAVPLRLKEWMEDDTNRDFLQSKLVTIRNGRFVVPIRSEMVSRQPWILQDKSASGATSYVEPLGILGDNNELANMRIQEKREVYRLLRHYTDELASRMVELEQTVDALGRLDALMGVALWCDHAGAIEPEITEGDRASVLGGRHPLLGDRAAPIDVELGGDVRALVITGPNAGGKTVSMKTIGLLQLLAQSGIHVPAERAALPVFKRIIAVIGDEQSIEMNLSSFSSHIAELRDAVELGGEGTLALIDEICAGTDPEEGSAIACGVLKWLIDRGAVTVVTSHMSRLKAFAAATPGAMNASMRFDDAAGRPSFVLETGLPGKSHAMETAAAVGLSRELLETAASYIDEGKRMTEKLLADLEDLKSVLSAERMELERERERLGRERRTAEKDRDARDEERRRLVAKACEDANKLLEETRSKCEDIFRRARESATLPARAAVKGDLGREEKKVGKIEKEHLPAGRRPDPSELKPDMWLQIRDTGEMGRYDSGPDRKGRVRLIVDGLPMLLPFDNVALPHKAPPAEKPPRPRDHERFVKEAVRRNAGELDLHGLRVREALELLEKELENSHLAGADRLRIVHGIGTGALMNAVREYLRDNVLVRRFESAVYTEGGIGVTIAYLAD